MLRAVDARTLVIGDVLNSLILNSMVKYKVELTHCLNNQKTFYFSLTDNTYILLRILFVTDFI